ncbi:MAG: B12-binding domain-containing radical SAM protein [Phycisphaerae bacterium]|nr:B12-binding domain-containing radical SAM protein [Phycisphaerae bacterium]
MRVLFLYPSAESQLGFNYGVAHMASILKQAGHHVAFWQLCEDIEPLPTEQQFLDRLAREKPDVLAFSVVTNQWAYAKQLARWARPRFAIPFVIGGVHTLMSVEEVLRTGLFDYAFRGECEDAFLEFVERLGRHESVESVPNLACARDGQMQVNPVGPLPELTRLPQKDYEVMDFQRLIDAKHGWVGLMASRGCPFSCTYCFNHVMVETYKQDLRCSFKGLNYIRRFSVAQMIEEVEYLLKNYRNIRMFIFDDDLFTFDKSYVEEFCRAYRKVSDIPFVVNAHVGFFDDECAAALAQAGCQIVKFGVESGSETVRRTILNRHMSNDSIVEAMATVRRHGMHSSVFIIIGFPHESADDVFDTIRLLGRARPGRFRWTFFFPFPGTRSHQISLDGGYINAEKMERLKNFTDESCLDFEPQHNLLLKKIGRIMPWFVNAYSDLPVAGFYRDKVEEILGIDEAQWNRVSGALLDRDKEYSQQHCAKGLSHYAVKYNRFMGVISDYFLRDP